MSCLRSNWPTANISPKLHMLEEHTVDFLKEWNGGLGFYGEQGGESLHHDFKRKKHMFHNMKNKLECLKYLMKQHLLETFPKTQAIKPVVQKRKRKIIDLKDTTTE